MMKKFFRAKYTCCVLENLSVNFLFFLLFIMQTNCRISSKFRRKNILRRFKVELILKARFLSPQQPLVVGIFKLHKTLKIKVKVLSIPCIMLQDLLLIRKFVRRTKGSNSKIVNGQNFGKAAHFRPF